MFSGVPGSPGPVLVDNVTALEATVRWQEPFSFFPITQYQITLFLMDAEVANFTVDPGDEEFSDQQLVIGSPLVPFRSYTVSVLAVNRVGSGPEATSMQFTTEQAGEFVGSLVGIYLHVVLSGECSNYNLLACNLCSQRMTFHLY